MFVWVESETRGSHKLPKKVALELLCKGRELADALGQELVAVVLSGEGEGLENALSGYGADRILMCQHELLKEYSTDGYTSVLCAVIAQLKPAVFLYGATPNGRDLAPRVAARLRLGLTADCTRLEIDDAGQLVQTRPAFGGNIMASIITPSTRPQTATVRPNVFPVKMSEIKKVPVVERFPVVLKRSAIRTRVISRQTGEGEDKDSISEARVIVAAGRGLQKPNNLSLVQELADLLGGTVGASRAIVEEGWLSHSRQVGQSGTTVSPELYIAVGISGAVQHVVGMSSSGRIIAINTDADAPIHKVADLSVAGDALTILPRVNALLKTLLGQE
ncbi:Caffeyl-CoA reductase-Etf complex subunit CarE [bioreactor metagenome]|uniref:Caffeyl-CoA reductase-Etf complex subunit CarE n=1 Tax=bioreactor metagenome TaxID=1076179 RepID=A0A644ZCJ7_9ZZZZ